MSGEELVEVALVWPGADDLNAQVVNQFLAQMVTLRDGRPNEFILIAGHATHPVTLGSVEEQKAMARALGAVAVKPVVKMAMTLERAAELHDLLGRVLNRAAGEGGAAQ